MLKESILYLFVCLSLKYHYVSQSTVLNIDFQQISKDFPHFWKNTGFCPLSRNSTEQFLLNNDEFMNLRLIGSMPYEGIKYIRIHWLLDLIHSTKSLYDYDYTHLDTLIEHLHDLNLKPTIELMGIPKNIHPKSVELKQKTFWDYFIFKLANRYIIKFGIDEVSTWRFESWNEPDLRMYNILNFTVAEYLHYVEGCGLGLKRAFGSEISRFGGPAGVFKNNTKHPLCWGLLEKCNSQVFRCPIQYITFHKKGNATVDGLLQETLDFIEDFDRKYPNLQGLPIGNDEADLLVNWSKNQSWRADTRYAAMALTAIYDFYDGLTNKNKNIEMISFDNGFLNYHPFYFTQRTLLARFQMNNTNPVHIQFVRKPIYNAMLLISYLDKNRLENLTVSNPDRLLRFIVTKSKYTTTILIVYSNNTWMNRIATKNVTISIRNSFKKSISIGYLLDNYETNPYAVWQSCGSPVYPNSTCRKWMRHAEGPRRVLHPRKTSNNFTLKVKLKIPSVFVLHSCSVIVVPEMHPGPVSYLSIFNITQNELLLHWSDHRVNTKCIRTYEIEFRRNEDDSTFQRINSNDIIFLSYQYVLPASSLDTDLWGLYRVRAIDYWNQTGNYSEIVNYP